MKFILHIVLIAGISAISQLFLPFWSVAIVAFVLSLIFNSRGPRSFLAGFLGVALLWSAAAWAIDMSTASILSEKIANILPLEGNVTILILITALLGGLVGGFGALSGSMLGAFFRKEKRKGYYS